MSDAAKEQPDIDEEEALRHEKQRSAKKTETSITEKLNCATKIKIHDPKWTDGSIPLDTVSENLARLGKV